MKLVPEAFPRLLALAAACLITLPVGAQNVPGVSNSTILLGQSAAFSGPAAQLGVQMNLGAKAYFDHVNAQGGVHGRKIELKTRDDKYEANLAAENTEGIAMGSTRRRCTPMPPIVSSSCFSVFSASLW